MKRASGPRLFILASILSLVAAPVSGVAQTAASKVPLTHGTGVMPERVGPAAGGYAPGSVFPGGEIKDGREYAFARAVPHSATYDGFPVEGPHLLIENASFSSALDIYSSKPVVLRGVSVRLRAPSIAALLTRRDAGPVFILWSDLGAAEGVRVDAGVMLRADNARLYRSHVSGAGDGVQISGSRVALIESVIEVRRAEPGDHNDAVQILGAPTAVVLARNRIQNANPQTSCVTILGSDIRLYDNVLSGGGWSIYGGARNNGKDSAGAQRVHVEGNVFGREYFAKGGHFGPVSYWDKANTWSNNRFEDGTPIVP